MASSAAGRNDPAPIIVKKVTVVEAGSYTHLRAHETGRKLVCRLLLEKKKTQHIHPHPIH